MEGYVKKHGKEGDKDPVNISYDLVIENEENINYLIELLKQKYDSIIKNWKKIIVFVKNMN